MAPNAAPFPYPKSRNPSGFPPVLMEVELPPSQILHYPVDASASDPKLLSDLSTLLVATIQEAKDRLSQLEFLFCSRLFPTFQSISRSLDSSCARENSLRRQIDDVRVENRREVDELRAEIARNEGVVQELRERLVAKAAEAAERKEMMERMMKQIDEKDGDLAAERSKKRRFQDMLKDLTERHKHLRSQYKYLLRKKGLVVEEEEDNAAGSPSLDCDRKMDRYCKVKDAATTPPVDKRERVDENNFQDRIGDVEDGGSSDNPHKYIRRESTSAPTSNLNTSLDASLHKNVSAKRSNPRISIWKDTRANQEQRGFDPHDNFLDTPLEMVRANLKKVPVEAQDISVNAPNDMVFNSSEDETQEVTVQPVPQKPPISIQRPPEKSFKYVEPVRKKAGRENLKGVECKQCKKFYDAVHPDYDKYCPGIRCEHHEGVSRHRYKYVPPSTPEGFWNIGFDSDI